MEMFSFLFPNLLSQQQQPPEPEQNVPPKVTAARLKLRKLQNYLGPPYSLPFTHGFAVPQMCGSVRSAHSPPSLPLSLSPT